MGYGGTKSEVERLIRDAEKLDSTFSVTHTKTKKGQDQIKYGYADVVQAIHIVQENMNITGTTAKEANDTIQGTAGSLKGAWDNLIIGLGNANADLGPLIDNVVKSALQMVNNIKPIALQAVKGIAALIEGFAPVLAEELPPMIEELLPTLANAIVLLINSLSRVLPKLVGTILPPLLKAVTGVIMSLLQALPQILQVLSSQLPVILQQLIPAILTLLPLLIRTGIEFVLAMGKGIADNIDLLMNAVMSIIHYLVDELLTPDNIAQFIQVALQIILAIAGGIIKNIPEILGAITILIWNIIQGLGQSLPEIGAQVIEFIVNLADHFGTMAYELFGDGFYKLLVGIGQWLGNIGSKVSGFVGGIGQTFANGWTNIKNGVSSFFAGIGNFFINGFNTIKTNVENSLNNIKSKFTSIFDGVKSTVKKAIDFIKGLFNFQWNLPKIKLPHFKVSGSFSLNPPKIPTFSVSWYKKAMNEPYILNDATIFGASNGKLLGGGEAGSEVVVGTSKLMSMMRQAVGGIGANPITINVYGAEGQDVRELAKAVSKEMQNMIDDRGRVYA